MRRVAPDGPVYQAGTLAGNPLAVAAGLASLRRVADDDGLYDRLERTGARLEDGLTGALRTHEVVGCVQRVGAMLTLFLGVRRVESWDDAAQVDRDAFAKWFHLALAGGVLLPPSPFEALFLMESHAGEVEQAVDVLGSALGTLAESGR